MIEAEVLLRVELAKFTAWQESLKFVPAISQLQQRCVRLEPRDLAAAGVRQTRVT